MAERIDNTSPDRRNFLLKVGATVGMAATLAASAVRTPEAQATAPELSTPATSPENNPFHVKYVSPPGVKITLGETAILKESLAATNEIKHRFIGAAILSHPTKSAMVSITKSPRAYTTNAGQTEGTFLPPATHHAVIPGPAIEMFGGREYLVGLTGTLPGKGYVDVKYAVDMGALHFFAYKGVKPKLVKFDNNNPSNWGKFPGFVYHSDKAAIDQEMWPNTQYIDATGYYHIDPHPIAPPHLK